MNHANQLEAGDYSHNVAPQAPPNLPQRAPAQNTSFDSAGYVNQSVSQPPPIQISTYNPAEYAGQSAYQPGPPPPQQAQSMAHHAADHVNQSVYQQGLPPPPQRIQQTYPEDDDPANPIHYVRDPSRLVVYLIPFPKPQLGTISPADVPTRFMIWTPPPPPLQKPGEGEKEGKLHKVQRKWQEEVRSAKTSTAKTASWKGVKSKATKGISWAVDRTTSSNLDFLGRMSPSNSDSEHEAESPTTKKTVPVEEMLLIYPPAMKLNNEQMRKEFVNTMLRTKTKAQRDTIIATGLLPVAYGIDILATLIWPFGGLGEIDTVWAFASFRGAKTARSVTKRLSSASKSYDPHNEHENDNQLKLNFVHSQRIEVLTRYLEAECHKIATKLFPEYHTSPTESNVLEAIGWNPSHVGGETKNWEDEQWEVAEVKDDLKLTFHKAAKEWRKWCLMLEKNPEKAAKK
ncbi:hypothetical protein H2198_003900 [Neophaeococcomyces mojaviensis]|uniref:Uncharacterized protein n=1 Tax=Neophaeococcomyces mojaviensis TaxID=3383035 RepID=A0ACC3A9Y1_9EURO|nr:hypothetical protein H2198_003900 [Knufia sp. JES_112]